MSDTYTSEFYDVNARGSFRSAVAVLRFLFQRMQPKSIIDVGCGVGAWLEAAKELRVQSLLGLEGAWIKDRVTFEVPIQVHDLETPIRLDRKFDLAMCMEVAEHLSEQRAKSLVQDLCRLSDQVLFSAAIPGQPGANHINCQWQTWWSELFEQSGLVPFDIIRRAMWTRGDVCYWYKQNTILYVTPEIGTTFDEPPTMVLHDLVHPDLYQSKIGDPSFTQLVKQAPASFGRAIRRRLRATPPD